MLAFSELCDLSVFIFLLVYNCLESLQFSVAVVVMDAVVFERAQLHV